MPFKTENPSKSNGNVRMLPDLPNVELSAIYYLATLRSDFEMMDLFEVIALNNVKHGITGMICFNEDASKCLQYFEGPHQAVRQLWENITKDARIETMEEYVVGFNIRGKLFPTWNMKQVGGHNFDRLLRKFRSMPFLLEPQSQNKIVKYPKSQAAEDDSRSLSPSCDRCVVMKSALRTLLIPEWDDIET